MTLTKWLQNHHVLHTWSKWNREQWVNRTVIEGIPLEGSEREVIGQSRCCLTCGKVELREL